MKQSGFARSGSIRGILPATESERVLGKAIDHEHNLGDLLRRPNVSYESLMSLDGGKYRSDATVG